MIRHILIIRFRRIGDSVLSMALCHSLKLSFPEAQVHFVINKGIASLYNGHPDVDKVIPFDSRQQHGWAYAKRVREIMKATHYDAIIDMRATPKTLLFSLCSLSTPYRIGRRKWYNRLVHNYRIATPNGADRVQSNLGLMAPLAREGKLIQDLHFPLYVTEEERQEFRTYMAAQGIDFSRPVIVAAITTRIPHKAWSQERMTEILRLILQHTDAQIVANYGGSNERTVAMEYKKRLDDDPRFFVNVEANTLRQLCALLANSQFFFGNEGGPRHMAQAFGVPAFAIYPPGIAKTMWLPAEDRSNQGISPDDFLTPQEQEDMNYTRRFGIITVQRVWERLAPMLAEFLPKR